ncbi:adenylyl-sulfate kinase [Sphingomonas sp. ASV193]|uniref:adenylyl-sulfate kinase n=1 Tax=Sphingomonas sp. ASV193 TaxID=3144405 RepID=UPI0032E8C0B0
MAAAPDTDTETGTTLRFLTCGSVDDGKSTLLGRLLFDLGQVPDDQLAALERDSARHGTRGSATDYALLVDGLSAEREQGITIDVAYRYFASAKRHFIAADCPGHEQYTRNMVTGASTADAAVVLVDARKGVLEQTRRHSFVCALMGIRHVAVAVTKMDLADWDEAAFRAIEADYAELAGKLGIERWTAIPLSGVSGDNVVARGGTAGWYEGPTLLDWLEAVRIEDGLAALPLRFPVQLVQRPDVDFRGYAGTIAQGSVAPGDPVRLLPSGRTTSIARVIGADGERGHAEAGEAVTLTLADEVDCARGDVVASAKDAPEVADQHEAMLVWLAEEPMLPGRQYALKLATQNAVATLAEPKHKVAIATFEELAARTLEMNEIGPVVVTTDREIVAEPYAAAGGPVRKTMGGFILIDRDSGATVAAGMIRFALRRALNIHRQPLDVSRETHAALKGQRPAVLWFTGLSGAGKSTIANLVEKRLAAKGRHSFLLDGDNVRHGLNKDLGFTDADRVENIRRVGEVARLMADAGLIVLTAFISPFRAEREMVRAMLPEGEFVEIFVDTPLAEAEARDVKGLYAKARAGELPNFTGIDSPYEPPEAPDLRIDTGAMSPEEAAEAVIRLLESRSA